MTMRTVRAGTAIAGFFALWILSPSPASGAAGTATTGVVSLDARDWLLATDPQNIGRD
jgi:hypothetical protein